MTLRLPGGATAMDVDLRAIERAHRADPTWASWQVLLAARERTGVEDALGADRAAYHAAWEREGQPTPRDPRTTPLPGDVVAECSWSLRNEARLVVGLGKIARRDRVHGDVELDVVRWTWARATGKVTSSSWPFRSGPWQLTGPIPKPRVTAEAWGLYAARLEAGIEHCSGSCLVASWRAWAQERTYVLWAEPGQVARPELPKPAMDLFEAAR
jgi:hypothetical protein